MSIQAPNYTQVPNALFELMPDMDKSELKVVLAVCRMTIGWHKTKDRLTITRLMDLTGLSRQSVYDGVEAAKARGILNQEETTAYGYIYSLDIEVSNEEIPSVQPLDTQKKLSKEKINTTSNAVDGNEQPNPYKTWESIGYSLTPYISERLGELEKDYTARWVCEAIRRAASQNVRKLSYIEGILEHWRIAGGMDSTTNKEGITKGAPVTNAAPQWVTT